MIACRRLKEVANDRFYEFGGERCCAGPLATGGIHGRFIYMNLYCCLVVLKFRSMLNNNRNKIMQAETLIRIRTTILEANAKRKERRFRERAWKLKYTKRSPLRWLQSDNSFPLHVPRTRSMWSLHMEVELWISFSFRLLPIWCWDNLVFPNIWRMSWEGPACAIGIVELLIHCLS